MKKVSMIAKNIFVIRFVNSNFDFRLSSFEFLSIYSLFEVMQEKKSNEINEESAKKEESACDWGVKVKKSEESGKDQTWGGINYQKLQFLGIASLSNKCHTFVWHTTV
jgi:hypothetical protein